MNEVTKIKIGKKPRKKEREGEKLNKKQKRMTGSVGWSLVWFVNNEVSTVKRIILGYGG